VTPSEPGTKEWYYSDMKRTKADRRRSDAERLARMGAHRLTEATVPRDTDDVAETVQPQTASSVDRATFRRAENGRIVRPDGERTVVGEVRAGELDCPIASAGDGERRRHDHVAFVDVAGEQHGLANTLAIFATSGA
jgi:hypothetical protein